MPMSAVKTPSAYASEYRTALRNRASQPITTAIRRMTPVVWPGAPWEAFLGFTTDAGAQSPATVDTAVPPVNNPFHEIGYFQTEAGPRGEPAPSQGMRDNTWRAIANDPLVIAALGRPLPLTPDTWKTDIDAQAAAGLVGLRKHAEGVNRLLDPSVRAASLDLSSPWAVALGFMGFSAGDGGAARHVNRYKTQLAAVPEHARWSELVRVIANEATQGVSFAPGGDHANPAYTVMRTWQKLASGKQSALDAGNADAAARWFGPQISDPAAAEAAVTAAARGQHPGHTTLLTLEQEHLAEEVIGGVAVAWPLVAGGVFLTLTAPRWWAWLGSLGGGKKGKR